MKKKILWIGIGIILVLASTFLLVKGKITGDVVENSGDIKILLSEISEEAKWYEYDSGGTKISFFAIKASDGTIRTAFDACDVCYSSNKGYRQEGNYMVCNNCGNRYPISGLGTENLRGGGCWPGYLPSKTDGENLIIKISDLEKGKYRFK